VAGRHRRPRPSRATPARAAGVLGAAALTVPVTGATALADAPPSLPGTPTAPKAGAQQATDTAASPVRGEAVVQEASEHEGKPYRWGAEGPGSFDCSGFTQYVYDEVGVALPRTADQQRDAVPRVPKSDMQRGDLVFFHDSTGFVYHVGIYAGGGEVWAATKPGDTVRTQDIWTSAFTVGRPHVRPGQAADLTQEGVDLAKQRADLERERALRPQV
jgi:cell wall-associated NlpC family hydrolase